MRRCQLIHQGADLVQCVVRRCDHEDQKLGGHRAPIAAACSQSPGQVRFLFPSAARFRCEPETYEHIRGRRDQMSRAHR